MIQLINKYFDIMRSFQESVDQRKRMGDTIPDQDYQEEYDIWLEKFYGVSIECQTAYSKWLDNLYQIAIDMYFFKKNGGDLQQDYGDGILIMIFFERIYCSGANKNLEKYHCNYFKELDNKKALKNEGLKFYQELEEEWKNFLENRRGSIQFTQRLDQETEEILNKLNISNKLIHPRIKTPEELMDSYNKITNSLGNVKSAFQKTSRTKTFSQAHKEELYELYNIAIEIHSFKKSGGNLQYNYGDGMLIKRFFDRIIYDNKAKLCEPYTSSQLEKIDKHVSYIYPNLRLYKLLETERDQFLKDNPNITIRTYKESLLERMEQLPKENDQGSNDFYTRRLKLEQASVKNKYGNCVIQ